MVFLSPKDICLFTDVGYGLVIDPDKQIIELNGGVITFSMTLSMYSMTLGRFQK